MKKTIFTFCSIAVVCCAIFFACAKDDNSITHVTYASQSSAGTGGNPDPNHSSTTSSIVTPTVTTPNTSGSITISGGTAKTTTDNGAAVSGSYTLKGTASTGEIVKISFLNATAPTSGSYNIVASSPTATDCLFTYYDASLNSYPASSGTVTISTGSTNTCTFSNISCVGSATYAISGTLNY